METATPGGLTPRQRDVMELVAKGLTNPEIRSVLGIATSTIKVHLAAIFRALDVTNRTEAASAWAALHQQPAPDDGGFRPTLCVLPLAAYSIDPEDAVLADGLTEDITSLLARLPGITVVGRGSAVAISRGEAETDARRAHDQLGVRYAVEGSVRRSQDRIRVTARLVSAESGNQLFAERWDRPTADLFSVVDEVVDGIAAQLASELTLAEAKRADPGRPTDVSAWALYQRAIVTFHYESYARDNSALALELLDDALAIDPDYAYALAFRSTLLSNRVAHGWADDAEAERDGALESGRRALARAPDDPLVLQHWGSTLSVLDDPAKAIFPLQRSIEGNPSDAHAWAQLGLYLGRTGRTEEATAHLERAFRLSPHDPRCYLWHTYEGVSAIVAGDWERVIDRCRATLELRADQTMTWAILASVLAFTGRTEEAREPGRRALELRPHAAFGSALKLLSFHRPAAELERWRAAQLEAGLVEDSGDEPN